MTDRGNRITRRALEVAAFADAHPIPEPERAMVEVEDLSGTIDERRHEQWRGKIPARFIHARLDDFALALADDVFDSLVAWSIQPDGRNLLLAGATGTGKTHAAVAAIRPAFEHQLDVAFWPLAELLDALRPPADPGLVDLLSYIDRLIVDDVGAERPSEWTNERLFILLNRRWLEELPTVLTTNLPPDGLRDSLGERLYSRVQHEALAVWLATPRDRRAS